MEKSKRKVLNKVNIHWSPRFAYAIGLLCTDGCVSSDKRHIIFVSKDREQVENLKKCLRLNNIIGIHKSGVSKNTALRIQFGDRIFYEFLISIGITRRKSKTMDSIIVPNKYFLDFLRGHFDGDGCFYSYWDKRWKSSFMIYIELTSASEKHLMWLQKRVRNILKINGRITKSKNNSAFRLKYAKKESLKLVSKLYYNKNVVCLSRKKEKIEKALKIIGERLV